MHVTLLYFDGCPNWHAAELRLREALAVLGVDQQVVHREQVTTAEQAEHWGFRGSPTFLVDGRDPFADPGAPVGLSCRLFLTPDGPAGAPTVDQLVAALSQS